MTWPSWPRRAENPFATPSPRRVDGVEEPRFSCARVRFSFPHRSYARVGEPPLKCGWLRRRRVIERARGRRGRVPTRHPLGRLAVAGPERRGLPASGARQDGRRAARQPFRSCRWRRPTTARRSRPTRRRGPVRLSDLKPRSLAPLVCSDCAPSRLWRARPAASVRVLCLRLY